MEVEDYLRGTVQCGDVMQRQPAAPVSIPVVRFRPIEVFPRPIVALPVTAPDRKVKFPGRLEEVHGSARALVPASAAAEKDHLGAVPILGRDGAVVVLDCEWNVCGGMSLPEDFRGRDAVGDKAVDRDLRKFVQQVGMIYHLENSDAVDLVSDIIDSPGRLRPGEIGNQQVHVHGRDAGAVLDSVLIEF